MNSEETRFDPRQRRLCPDGACVGLIGNDNRCKLCGARADGSAASNAAAAAADSGAITLDGDKDDKNSSDGSDDETLPRTLGDVAHLDEGGAGFDPGRRLCSDGACLGVIVADGRCNVCGRPGE